VDQPEEDEALDSDGRLTHGEQSGQGEFTARAGVALVLGASGGLGAAIAAMLLARGSRVAMTYPARPPPWLNSPRAAPTEPAATSST